MTISTRRLSSDAMSAAGPCMPFAAAICAARRLGVLRFGRRGTARSAGGGALAHAPRRPGQSVAT